MALSSPNLLLRFPTSSSASPPNNFCCLLFYPHSSPCQFLRSESPLLPISPKLSISSSKVRCIAKQATEEAEEEDEEADDRWVASSDGEAQDTKLVHPKNVAAVTTTYSDSPSLGIREPVYEVVEVKANGMVSTRKINRRQLLKSSGLRPRDIRSVDPSLFLTNSMPSLLVREHAILLNLGSLRAIAMQECVLVFDHNRKGGKAFIDTLLPRLSPSNTNGGPCMPFELEVVEAALLSRVQRLEERLMAIEPRIQALLEVLPNRFTADVLEELRISKQKLVELGSRAEAFRQMLLNILEDAHEIRRISIVGRNCILKGEADVECSVPLEKQIAEEEEEEIEMLLENYLQRCESCHGQAERLLDSAKETEDSIDVNLSTPLLSVPGVLKLVELNYFFRLEHSVWQLVL